MIKQKKKAKSWLKTFLSIVAAVIVYGIFLAMSGANPLEIYNQMITQTLGNGYGIGQVIVKSTPLILVAVATSISAKAGLVNVGGEGQLVLGALTSTVSAVFILGGVPSVVGIPLMAISGMLGGMLWSGLAGVMRVRFNMNETLTTVIMNYIAYDIISYFVYGSLKDPESFNWPMSPKIGDNLKLLEIYPGVSIGIIVAVVIAIITWFVLSKSASGFRLRVIGGNVEAAKHAGISVASMQMKAFLISGAISGLAGMIEIAGVEGRLRTTTGTNYGYYGFLAAWMAWNNPIVAIFTALVIGFLSVSGNVVEISSGLPSSCTKILMAIILLSILWKGKKHD